MHDYVSACADCCASGKVEHPVHFDVAKKAADCLDDHHAGLAALAPEMRALALSVLRKFIFANPGSPEAQRLAGLSWIAADILERILDESVNLFGDAA